MVSVQVTAALIVYYEPPDSFGILTLSCTMLVNDNVSGTSMFLFMEISWDIAEAHKNLST